MRRGYSADKEWQTINIGKVCDIYNGATPLKGNKHYWENGVIPWFTVSDIREQGRIIKYTNQKITTEGLNNSSVKILPRKSVLLCCTASIGEHAFADIELTTNQQFNALVIKKEYVSDIIPEFLFIVSGTLKKDLIRRSGKTSFDFVSIDELRRITIPLPPIEKQKEIVAIISTWDTAIDMVKELINLKELRVQYLIKENIDTQNKFEDTELMKLRDIGEFASAGVDKKIIEGEKKVRLVNYLDIYRKHKLKASDFNHVVSASQYKINKCDVKKGDIFFTPSSETKIDIASSAIAIEDMPSIVYSYHIVRFRPKINLDLDFSAYMFMGHNFRKQASRYSEGSGQRYVISKSLFGKLEVPVPKLHNQVKIARVLDSAYEEISLFKAMLKNYELQRRGLIQELVI